jgi:hypothetical protein
MAFVINKYMYKLSFFEKSVDSAKVLSEQRMTHKLETEYTSKKLKRHP